MMKWFEGSIVDAVTTSKRRKSIFVVFIEGKDGLSKDMASAFDQSEISDRLSSDSFVSVKLESGSESHKQFNEIYKLVPVPSVFFIGQNGSPLEIIAGAEISIVSKLQAAVEKFHSKNSATATSSPGTSGLNTSQISSQSESVPVSQTSPVTKSDGEQVNENLTAAPVTSLHSDSTLLSSESKEAVPQPSVDIALDNSPSSLVSPLQDSPEVSVPTNLPESSPSATDVTVEEKVERARKLLEIKKEQKRAQEEQEVKEKEMERRKTGQAIMEAKRKQQERELQELMEEKKRTKLEEQLAKQRILDQIAQDRADRAARNAVLTLSDPTPSASSAVQSQHPLSSAGVDVNTARLQFKMPDGQSRTHSFPAETTLSQVRQFIDNNIELPFREYQMATTFPRREFTSRDLDSDLRSLGLLPSAVILIMPLQGNMSLSTGPGWSGALMDLLWSLVQPLITFSRYLQGLVWGSRDRDVNNQTNEPANNAPSSHASNPRVSAASGGRGIRKRGNIHSLTDADNSNDENNTWNGNSTQQM